MEVTEIMGVNGNLVPACPDRKNNLLQDSIVAFERAANFGILTQFRRSCSSMGYFPCRSVRHEHLLALVSYDQMLRVNVETALSTIRGWGTDLVAKFNLPDTYNKSDENVHHALERSHARCMTLLGTHAADLQALLIDYREKVNVMKKTTNAEVLASIMRATEKYLDSLKTSKGLHSEDVTKLRSLYVETDIAGESGNRVLLGLIPTKDLNNLPKNIAEFPRFVSQCESTWRQLGQLEKEYEGALALLAKFKVNPEYLRHTQLPEVLVSTKRGAETLAEVVARTSNIPHTSTTMSPLPIKRQKQHINTMTNKGYNSPFLPWLSGAKRQPRIPKTAAQERLVSSSADRSLSRKSENASGGTTKSLIIVDETETDKKISSSSSPDKPASSGTGSGKTTGTGSRSNHGEARKEIVEEQNRIVSEAKEDAEKRRRDEAKKTREKEDRDNQKTNSGSSRNEKKEKKTKKKSSRSVSRS
jgi:hypothetical protein